MHGLTIKCFKSSQLLTGVPLDQFTGWLSVLLGSQGWAVIFHREDRKAFPPDDFADFHTFNLRERGMNQ